MSKKKHYIWQLAVFLRSHGMTMSAYELAEHLNRNNILTESGEEFQGGQGTYRLISLTWEWVQNELLLPDEAKKIAEAFVKDDGTYAYQ
jgi:hypothetical protein